RGSSANPNPDLLPCFMCSLWGQSRRVSHGHSASTSIETTEQKRTVETVPEEGAFAPMELNLRLNDMGWNSFFESHFGGFKQTGLTPARVVEELKGFYRVRAAQGEY